MLIGEKNEGLRVNLLSRLRAHEWRDEITATPHPIVPPSTYLLLVVGIIPTILVFFHDSFCGSRVQFL